MCVLFIFLRQMTVTSGNQLVECQECHNLYHQDCHKPQVTDKDVNDPRLVWYCARCTRQMKRMVRYSQGIHHNLLSQSLFNKIHFLNAYDLVYCICYQAQKTQKPSPTLTSSAAPVVKDSLVKKPEVKAKVETTSTFQAFKRTEVKVSSSAATHLIQISLKLLAVYKLSTTPSKMFNVWVSNFHTLVLLNTLFIRLRQLHHPALQVVDLHSQVAWLDGQLLPRPPLQAPLTQSWALPLRVAVVNPPLPPLAPSLQACLVWPVANQAWALKHLAAQGATIMGTMGRAQHPWSHPHPWHWGNRD